MTPSELLALVKGHLTGCAESAKALADAYEEAGESDFAAWIRSDNRSTLYVCRRVVKTVIEDSFEEGAFGGERYEMDDDVHVVANDLPSLLKAIGDCLDLDIDEVFIPGGEVTRLVYDRLENGEGQLPTMRERLAWERGEKTLFASSYAFFAEKRTNESIPIEEFARAGIKHTR